jgi:hypothetical protein
LTVEIPGDRGNRIIVSDQGLEAIASSSIPQFNRAIVRATGEDFAVLMPSNAPDFIFVTR